MDRLTTSDHRRAVRPKARQKASASHLKILNNRTGVSSDINQQDEEEGKLDPNTYSTYMGEWLIVLYMLDSVDSNVLLAVWWWVSLYMNHCSF